MAAAVKHLGNCAFTNVLVSSNDHFATQNVLRTHTILGCCEVEGGLGDSHHAFVCRLHAADHGAAGHFQEGSVEIRHNYNAKPEELLERKIRSFARDCIGLHSALGQGAEGIL